MRLYQLSCRWRRSWSRSTQHIPKYYIEIFFINSSIVCFAFFRKGNYCTSLEISGEVTSKGSCKELHSDPIPGPLQAGVHPGWPTH